MTPGSRRPAPLPSGDRGAPEKLSHSGPSPQWLLGSPWRQLRAQRRHSFSGLAARPWVQGQGPQVFSHFREVFLLQGQWNEGKLLSRLGLTPALVPSRSVTLGKTHPSSVCSLMNRNEEVGPEDVEGSTFLCEVWDPTGDSVGWVGLV